ncbi:hypothetical protein AAHA92_30156 [Salvia divinorum]|uniref:Secreted protein n=1 Tax=Salvia divinorum TaxID=28513 RepID=A0ABD1G0Q6_SALDI
MISDVVSIDLVCGFCFCSSSFATSRVGIAEGNSGEVGERGLRFRRGSMQWVVGLDDPEPGSRLRKHSGLRLWIRQ